MDTKKFVENIAKWVVDEVDRILKLDWEYASDSDYSIQQIGSDQWVLIVTYKNMDESISLDPDLEDDVLQMMHDKIFGFYEDDRYQVMTNDAYGDGNRFIIIVDIIDESGFEKSYTKSADDIISNISDVITAIRKYGKIRNDQVGITFDNWIDYEDGDISVPYDYEKKEIIDTRERLENRFREYDQEFFNKIDPSMKVLRKEASRLASEEEHEPTRKWLNVIAQMTPEYLKEQFDELGGGDLVEEFENLMETTIKILYESMKEDGSSGATKTDTLNELSRRMRVIDHLIYDVEGKIVSDLPLEYNDEIYSKIIDDHTKNIRSQSQDMLDDLESFGANLKRFPGLREIAKWDGDYIITKYHEHESKGLAYSGFTKWFDWYVFDVVRIDTEKEKVLISHFKV